MPLAYTLLQITSCMHTAHNNQRSFFATICHSTENAQTLYRRNKHHPQSSMQQKCKIPIIHRSKKNTRLHNSTVRRNVQNLHGGNGINISRSTAMTHTACQHPAHYHSLYMNLNQQLYTRCNRKCTRGSLALASRRRITHPRSTRPPKC